MRGKLQAQPDFLTGINLNRGVPADHPLRAIKTRVGAVLQTRSPLFDELYADGGRDSIPPEQLLKARVRTALYSVRSERLFCEQPGGISSGFGFWTASSAKGALTTAALPRTTTACFPPTWPDSFSSQSMI